QVGADLDEQRVGPGILNAGAAVFAVEVLHVNVEALVGEEFAASGAHAMRHVGAVKGIEELGDAGRCGARLHASGGQRAVHFSSLSWRRKEGPRAAGSSTTMATPAPGPRTEWPCGGAASSGTARRPVLPSEPIGD